MNELPGPQTYALLGTARYNLADYEGAIRAWDKASDLSPRYRGEMLNNIGNALRDQGRLEEAEAAYAKAMEIEPDRWTASINLASMLYHRGEPQTAVGVLTKAQRANPEQAEVADLLRAYQVQRTP